MVCCAQPIEIISMARLCNEEPDSLFFVEFFVSCAWSFWFKLRRRWAMVVSLTSAIATPDAYVATSNVECTQLSSCTIYAAIVMLNAHGDAYSNAYCNAHNNAQGCKQGATAAELKICYGIALSCLRFEALWLCLTAARLQDEEAALLAELERIKKERAEEARKKVGSASAGFRAFNRWSSSLQGNRHNCKKPAAIRGGFVMTHLFAYRRWGCNFCDAIKDSPAKEFLNSSSPKIVWDGVRDGVPAGLHRQGQCAACTGNAHFTAFSRATKG
eukprot:1155712-Pelagomonas_calceolata.AAC.5